MFVVGVENSRAAPITARNASDATIIRRPLNACGSSSRTARFDDGEVAAPDDGHQEQEGVEGGDAAGVVLKGVKGSTVQLNPEPLNPLNP